MGKCDEDVDEAGDTSPLMISGDVEDALADIPDLQRRNEIRCGIEKMLDHYTACGRIQHGRDWLSRQPDEIRKETARIRWEHRARRISVIAGTFAGSAATTFFGQ